MIEISGRIISKRECPYVYFIKKDRFLYIGETQSHPVLRWGQHLDKNGSFVRALQERDEEVYQNNQEIYFFAYCCRVVESSVLPVEKRRVTQFIEHQLHIRVICNRGKLYEPLELISDTKRTAPLYCNYRWIDQVVEDIFKAFLIDLSQSPSLTKNDAS
jgi:hypothetical protein